MPVPPIKPTAIAVYVYRKVAGGNLEFLQIRRSKTSASHHQTFQTVYGGIEPGETAIAAAIRELKEETGLKPAKMFQVEYIESFYYRPHDSLLLMPVFAVEVPADSAITLNHEHDAHRWVPEAQIPAAFMWRTQREALAILLETLHHGSQALPFLNVDL